MVCCIPQLSVSVRMERSGGSGGGGVGGGGEGGGRGGKNAKNQQTARGTKADIQNQAKPGGEGGK